MKDQRAHDLEERLRNEKAIQKQSQGQINNINSELATYVFQNDYLSKKLENKDQEI